MCYSVCDKLNGHCFESCGGIYGEDEDENEDMVSDLKKSYQVGKGCSEIRKQLLNSRVIADLTDYAAVLTDSYA